MYLKAKKYAWYIWETIHSYNFTVLSRGHRWARKTIRAAWSFRSRWLPMNKTQLVMYHPRRAISFNDGFTTELSIPSIFSTLTTRACPAGTTCSKNREILRNQSCYNVNIAGDVHLQLLSFGSSFMVELDPEFFDLVPLMKNDPALFSMIFRSVRLW